MFYMPLFIHVPVYSCPHLFTPSFIHARVYSCSVYASKSVAPIVSRLTALTVTYMALDLKIEERSMSIPHCRLIDYRLSSLPPVRIYCPQYYCTFLHLFYSFNCFSTYRSPSSPANTVRNFMYYYHPHLRRSSVTHSFIVFCLLILVSRILCHCLFIFMFILANPCSPSLLPPFANASTFLSRLR